jgi:hypothetical protein
MATGNDIYQKALTRNGQAYVEGTLVPKDDPNWMGPLDCAELCSWVLHQVAAIIYGCTSCCSGLYDMPLYDADDEFAEGRGDPAGTDGRGI